MRNNGKNIKRIFSNFHPNTNLSLKISSYTWVSNTSADHNNSLYPLRNLFFVNKMECCGSFMMDEIFFKKTNSVRSV